MTKRKILVVDDEEDIRSLVELYLLQNDYAVITAENGKQAFDKLQNEKLDLIVLDILLPDTNGLEICKKLQRIPGYEETPIIFLSSLQESESIITGLEVGGDDYITKPFDPNVLVARINAVFRRIQDKNSEDYQSMQEVLDELNFQERQILQWMEKGFTNKEIAAKLNLTEGTVKVYNHVIFQKLQVANRTQAIVLVKEMNFL